jgi:alanine racemase
MQYYKNHSKLQFPVHEQRTWIEIDITAFRHNIFALKKFIPPDHKIMQIVKADAYGHGALEIAKTAIECGAHSLGVANADEGALLRYHGFNVPILILSPSLISEIPLILENELIPSVSDSHFAIVFDQEASHDYPVHINVDTGMGRSGVYLTDAELFFNFCHNLKNIHIQGVFTHFAASENDPQYSQSQSVAFKNFIDNLPYVPEFIHSANSSALTNQSLIAGNLVRIGALSYGFYTHHSQKDIIDLLPVLKFKSRISLIKSAEKGDYIGYNRTYCCPDDLKYAIIPAGYADGYDFLLSNCGKVLINNALMPVIGKVSMDMIAVAITPHTPAVIGDEVILLGQHPHLRVEDVAAIYHGSPYELLCQTGRRAPRFYYDKGRLISSAPQLRRGFVSSDYNDAKLNRIIESAVRQRLQGSDIASFVYQDLLKNIFSDQDNNIPFRYDFRHTITFSNSLVSDMKDYYLTSTTLTYYKVINNSSFRIACANNENNLADYFRKPNVEYRWLLDESLAISPETFQLVSARINDIELYSSTRMVNNCLEITCFHEKLNELIGKKVKFSLNTITWYPKKYHRLSVFISDITCGFNLNFSFPPELVLENITPVLSGKKKSLDIETSDDSASISSPAWLFPTSAVIFVYSSKK